MDEATRQSEIRKLVRSHCPDCLNRPEMPAEPCVRCRWAMALIERYDQDHGLTCRANGWEEIDRHWGNHPGLRAVAEELAESGSYSAPRAYNRWIERLLGDEPYPGSNRELFEKIAELADRGLGKGRT
ncbi:MAG: hypothetical protein ABFE07_28270 [Armatimonadia bacterium]